jgi:heptosyltransferase-2
LYLDVLPDPSDSGDVDDLSLILSRPDNPARILTDSGMNLVAEAAGADGPLIVIAPYSTSDNRNWEDDRCVALCRWLRATYGALVAVTCSGRDRERGQALCRAVGEIGVECVSKASLTEYIALIAMSQLVVCADSSAMHIAAALGTPFVALFGATPVERRKPLRGRGVAVCKPIPCAPCDKQTCAHSEFRACMRAIELADVQAAVESPAVHDMNPSPGQPAPRQA